MDIVGLTLLFVALQLVPLSIVVLPVVVFFVLSRRSISAVVTWALAVLLLAFWFLAGIADIERADATGGEGNIYSGWQWLALAATAAVASSVLSVRSRTRNATTA